MIVLEPIGVVRSSRTEIFDDGWDAETVRVELDDQRFTPEALLGLDAFSHVEVVYWLDQVDPERIETGARHPRSQPRWPRVGIFAQRARNRPNQLGVSVCKVLRLDGRSVHLSGLDAVDGTPVLDLKPWLSAFGPRGAVREPEWAVEVMRGYWSGPDGGD